MIKKNMTGRAKGVKNKEKGTPRSHINPVVHLTVKSQKNLTRLLGRCVAHSLEYALKVLKNNEQVKVERLSKFHKKEIALEDRYPPEIKVKILEILINKVYADRKEQILEPVKDESALNIVSFDFVPLHPVGVPRDLEKAEKNRMEGMKNSQAYQDRAKNKNYKKVKR